MLLLRAVNITKKYDQYTALDGVSIDVPQGSIFGLLGPNGAGKTSLIRIINQITGPDSGALYYHDRPMHVSDIEKIGYLPEERGLYRKMAVGEQVIYLARLKGLSRHDALKKLKYWFEKFEITAWWNKKVEELSKGMQQKVQFIVTVLHEPEFLILDEPFSGFDPVNAGLIKEEILSLRKNGATVIFSTHNMASVEELCDHIALINKARKMLDGKVMDIRLAHRKHIFEIEFTGNTISFTNAIWTGCELLEVNEFGQMKKARVRLLYEATPNQLLEAILPHVQVNGLQEILPGMNDIFISMVAGNPSISTDLTE